MPKGKRQKAYHSDSESEDDNVNNDLARPNVKPLAKKAKKKLVVVPPPPSTTGEPRVNNDNNFFASALQAALATSNVDKKNKSNESIATDSILSGTRTTQQRQSDRLTRKAKSSGQRERRAIVLKINRQERPVFDELEKRLSKVAASGVVQLFNALKRQRSMFQRQLKGQSRVADKDRVAIQPKSFLATLAAADNAKKAARQPQVKSEVKQESKWSVLRDDFLEKEANAWDAED
jgi:hypothetical protein